MNKLIKWFYGDDGTNHTWLDIIKIFILAIITVIGLFMFGILVGIMS